jgi:hypothetical protein
MATDTLARIRARLSHVLQQQQECAATLQQLIEDPNTTATAIDAAQRRLTRVAAEQSRLLTELRIAQMEAQDAPARPASRAGSRPFREEVLDTIDEIGVPSGPRAICEFAFACCNRSLLPERFASLRRDEERAFMKDPLVRPAWVAPAINIMGLNAIPRLVTSSAWEPERRLVGSRSLRVNHLRTVLALLRAGEHAEQAGDDRGVQRIAALLSRYAETVRGALIFGEALDQTRVREATEAELARIEPTDLAERRAAARRLKSLPDAQRIWGRPVLLETGTSLRSTAQ